MNDKITIKRALISVFHKDGLDRLLKLLNDNGVKFISTGGTQSFIQSLGYECDAVENLTGYPSILGGRVKTLHPKVFGGILKRRDNETDNAEASAYDIPDIDLVIVDLYPFEETVANGGTESQIIEKIDIGGISLIRAAAKNFKDVVIVASKAQYQPLADIIESNGEACTTLQQRKMFARDAFAVSSGYDSAIFSYFDNDEESALRISQNNKKPLRYGENPHQKGSFFGDFNKMFTQLHGKEISYNNILDIDAACNLIADFNDTTFAILKHNNACGIASRPTVLQAWTDALAADPVSAFGGVLICNRPVDVDAANEINKIFFEVIIAPQYSEEALNVLTQKKNRIILVKNDDSKNKLLVRTALNGFLVQARDEEAESPLTTVTVKQLTDSQISDLHFANKVVKHSKSNAIVIARNKQLLANGVGQTSRVDALKQAIEKAKSFGFDLNGAVMASDAFFPFADCVEIADKAGINAVIHPGGSIRDNDSIEYCNNHNMAMATTGIRHFKH
ncbi:MAG: bifunctional phosphoribosylaminoimidazolecarboxamide formyltransferase/IMP cyclohydrolase [Muribaculaceae bacterium]|nr:bifunctional phosphoribosylaminoimidazolecarboxamide formyltransferase/IMP cyclohydrolase [Muribaculaceae bacterium]